MYGTYICPNWSILSLDKKNIAIKTKCLEMKTKHRSGVPITTSLITCTETPETADWDRITWPVWCAQKACTPVKLDVCESAGGRYEGAFQRTFVKLTIVRMWSLFCFCNLVGLQMFNVLLDVLELVKSYLRYSMWTTGMALSYIKL